MKGNKLQNVRPVIYIHSTSYPNCYMQMQAFYFKLDLRINNDHCFYLSGYLNAWYADKSDIDCVFPPHAHSKCNGQECGW